VASLQVQRVVDPGPQVGFRVRAARRGDVEGIASLLVQLGYTDGTDSATMNWVISHPEMELFVAADGQDRPVGVVTLSHRPQLRLKGRVITVDELAVAEAWRRRGVGKALLARVMERARALSAKRIEVARHPADRAVSVAFLEACGFQACDVVLCRR
jgi:N-acetylglutamate synthase-like GNAT family acetyltransferase